jgi:trigger factor
MEFKIEETSPVERTVKVTVPVEEVNAAILTALALYRRTAEVKGFRKGKVPSGVVEQRFRPQIYSEATTDLVNLHINEILAQSALQPISRIKVDSKELERDTEFTYGFSFEIAPDLDVPEIAGHEVEYEVPEVEEAEVEAVIERIRNTMAELVKVEEAREPKDGEMAVIDFTAFENGEPLGELKADNFQLLLGEGQALPAFEDIVKKLRPGETREEPISFPADFISPELAGRTVDMRVTLKEIRERRIPAADDAFAVKAGGFTDVAAMREAIKRSYLETRSQINRSVAQKTLLDRILQNVEVPLPPSMVEEHIDQLLAEMVSRLEEKGKSVKSLGKSPEELRAQFRPQAEDLVRAQVFLLAVARKENLTVEPQEVEEHIRREAMRMRKDPAGVRAFYEEHNLLFALRDRLMADKAMERIYSKAKVAEIPPEVWKQRRELEQAAARGEATVTMEAPEA